MCTDKAPIILFPSIFFSALSFVRLSNAHLPDKIRQRKNTVYTHVTYITYTKVSCFSKQKRRSQNNKKIQITHMHMFIRSLLQ